MTFVSKRKKLRLTAREREELQGIIDSEEVSERRMERAKILLGYADGKSISSLARELNTNRPKVERSVDKALRFGVLTALSDLPGRGKPRTISDAARNWVRETYKENPGWKLEDLVEYARKNCEQAGYPGLKKISKGTASKILRSRGAAHGAKKVFSRIFFSYQEIDIYSRPRDEFKDLSETYSANLSLDGNASPGHTYKDSVALFVALDLDSGHIHASVCDKYEKEEQERFFEEYINLSYKNSKKITIFLDPRKTKISQKNSKDFLAKNANRYEFNFIQDKLQPPTPTVILAERFLVRLVGAILKGKVIQSKNELKKMVEDYVFDFNQVKVI